MVNVAKILLALEGLTFPKKEDSLQIEVNAGDQKKRLEANLSSIKKFVNIESLEVLNNILTHLNLNWGLPAKMRLLGRSPERATPTLFTDYAIHLEYILLELANQTNFNSDAREDLVSMRHTNLCIEGIQDLSTVVLCDNFHPLFYTRGLFTSSLHAHKPFTGNEGLVAARSPHEKSPNYDLVLLTVNFLEHMLKIKQFHINNSMSHVIRNYMAAIISMQVAHSKNEWDTTDAEMKLIRSKMNYIWNDISKVDFMRNLMQMNSMEDLPDPILRSLSSELTSKLMLPDGFISLVLTLRTSQGRNVCGQEKRMNEVVANLVASPLHSKRFQSIIIRNIFDFCRNCLLNEKILHLMGTGLLALNRISERNPECRPTIKLALDGLLAPLIQPKDLCTGVILLEHDDYCLLITLFFHLFCTSNLECLPSEFLVPQLPLLLQLHYHTPAMFPQKQQLAMLVVRCLHNRERKELSNIVEKLYSNFYDPEWHTLHPRVCLVPNDSCSMLTVRVASTDYKPEFSISLSLPQILITTEMNLLTYEIFMILLELMAHLIMDVGKGKFPPEEHKLDLMSSEDELLTFLNHTYPTKIEILLSLNVLISIEALKSQITENSLEFLKFMTCTIQKRLNFPPQKDNLGEDQILIIILSITEELLHSTELPERFEDLTHSLEQLKGESSNQMVKRRCESLINLLNGGFQDNLQSTAATAFKMARNLIESKETHLQVYGLQCIMDLLLKKDDYAKANGHVILALALTTLKEQESYTFLNCVRLFVALVDIMEAEVLNVLQGEYLNEHADNDYRLVVGEAILRVSKEIGPLAYKYKDKLIDIFVSGARSPNDEFRMSSYANLAQLCKTLTYQVHSFFQELLNLIDSELTTGTYLPAKRAAVLVLVELLEGIDSLMDFQDMLLPIYRALKLIEGNELEDDKLRQHAANGLHVLAEKCKKFLVPEAELKKEIKIFGIKEESQFQSPGKRSIIELN